jgi:hypothetical protein
LGRRGSIGVVSVERDEGAVGRRVVLVEFV